VASPIQERLSFGVLVAALTWSSGAAARKPPAESGGRAPTNQVALDKLGEVDVDGRAFARAALVKRHDSIFDAQGVERDRTRSSFDLTVPTARLGARYDAVRYVSAAVEVELTDKPELKDAWVRARTDHFGMQVGQFKVPFSAFELESRWDLPTAGRGLVHDILVDELEVAGRRPGVTVSARQKGGKQRWSLTLGSFQGSVLVERDGTEKKTDPFSEQTLRTQSLVARAELRFSDLTAGAGFEQRVGTPGVVRSERYFTAGGDLVLDTKLRGGGLRVWAEGLFGGSWLEHTRKPTDDVDAVFASGRLMAAARFGGKDKGARYLEPYGYVGVFDPDTVVAFDLASEQTLGVNVGFWNVARIGVEATLTHLERNFPRAYGFGTNPNRQTLLAQAGATF
jgi:hypothetical protein